MAATGAAGAAALAAPQKAYLIVNNVQKNKNIKNMLISASSFGVSEVFIVGQKKFDLDEHADFLAKLSCPITRIATLSECRAHCLQRGIRICGVEILGEAKSILDAPFRGDTAFIMGNEGAGMNAAQVAICDDFVYIPQYGGGTASLNVTVAASIIMHSFALWAEIPEAPSDVEPISPLLSVSNPQSRMAISLARRSGVTRKDELAVVQAKRRMLAQADQHPADACIDKAASLFWTGVKPTSSSEQHAVYANTFVPIAAEYEGFGWTLHRANEPHGISRSEWVNQLDLNGLEKQARTLVLVTGDGDALQDDGPVNARLARVPAFRVVIHSWLHAIHTRYFKLQRQFPKQVRLLALDDAIDQLVCLGCGPSAGFRHATAALDHASANAVGFQPTVDCGRDSAPPHCRASPVRSPAVRESQGLDVDALTSCWLWSRLCSSPPPRGSTASCFR